MVLLLLIWYIWGTLFLYKYDELYFDSGRNLLQSGQILGDETESELVAAHVGYVENAQLCKVERETEEGGQSEPVPADKVPADDCLQMRTLLGHREPQIGDALQRKPVRPWNVHQEHAVHVFVQQQRQHPAVLCRELVAQIVKVPVDQMRPQAVG